MDACPSDGSRVLLVEDDADIQEGVCDLIHAAGYEVRVVDNGREALEYLRDAKRLPCLVILDLFMPEMNGHELLKLLRQDDRFIALPVAVFSASDDVPPGAHRYIKKPFELDALLDAVSSFCEPHDPKSALA
jgi:CheY-like chemotaxis protein